MLSGLGVPDVRGLNGQPTLYTTREDAKADQFAVKVVKIASPLAPGSEVVSTLEGPRNVLFPPRLRAALEKAPDSSTAEELRDHADDEGVSDEEMDWSGLDAFLDQHAAGAITREEALAAASGAEPRLAIPITFRAEGAGATGLTIECGDRTSTVARGGWSDWHVVEFPFNRLIRAKGMVRFYNQSDDRRVEILASPIHFHPDAGALVGFCHPDDFAKELREEVGLFKTMGWASDTWTVSDGLSSDQEALEDIQFTTDGFERIMEAELRRDTDLFVQVFAFTDRIQHVFWRLRDPLHPGYDEALAKRYEGVVERAYERMDAIVGKARAAAPGAEFFVLSDHGFASFRRGVNLNRWLVNHGYMVLRRDPCDATTGTTRSLDDLFGSQRAVWSEVDWPRTRAYAMGLGNVYVNVAGREPEGVVRPGQDYDDTVAALSRELEALVDPRTGERPVVKVHRRDDDYSGYDPEVVPDLRVANSDGYRVSWDTVLGGLPCEEIEDNDKAWGGDHCSLEPRLVKGILLSSRKLRASDPEMADVMPTLLAALGLDVPPGLDGASLW
jgi:predicted AlkP superfamily phosphohydrolase/phosphomutase